MKSLVSGIVALFGLVGVILASSIWFKSTHIGWLIEDIPDVLAYRKAWQAVIERSAGLQHPAVIHFQPEGCLCRALSSKHAAAITSKALESDFQVYQINSQWKGLGRALSLSDLPTLLGPQIVITRQDGSLAYAGAYSDGIRCNTGTSMVDRFLESQRSLPDQTVIGLDVKTCRCLE